MNYKIQAKISCRIRKKCPYQQPTENSASTFFMKMENWHENEPAQVELAFQRMFGICAPYRELALGRKMTNTCYNIGFCLRYSFLECIAKIDTLYLYHFGFEEVSQLIGQLKHLEEIELRHNNISLLLAQIGYLRKLWRLDIESKTLACRNRLSE